MNIQNSYWLKLTLLSDASLGRGDGVAGMVDAEVQHDNFGLPYLGGKTLKGLLAATCAEILTALDQAGLAQYADWKKSARRLFGSPGSLVESLALMHVGDAQLPETLRQAAAYEAARSAGSTWRREDVLNSLTTLRRQTAMDPVTGTFQKATLRTVRVILRDISFSARLDFIDKNPSHTDLALLAACCKGLRRAGTARNRGRGRIAVALYDRDPFTTPEPSPVTDEAFMPMKNILQSPMKKEAG